VNKLYWTEVKFALHFVWASISKMSRSVPKVKPIWRHTSSCKKYGNIKGKEWCCEEFQRKLSYSILTEIQSHLQMKYYVTM